MDEDSLEAQYSSDEELKEKKRKRSYAKASRTRAMRKTNTHDTKLFKEKECLQ